MRRTKVSYEIGLCSIGSPFSIHNGAVVVDVESKLFKALERMSAIEMRLQQTPIHTLVNVSNPPSEALIFVIQSWALE